MAISIDEAYADLHNLHVREPLRRYQPQIMLVAVDPKGIIVKTEKLKKAPEVEDLHRFSEGCKPSSIFIADTENFDTIEEFRRVVTENGDAIRSRVV